MDKIIINMRDRNGNKLLIECNSWEDGVILLEEAMNQLDNVPIKKGGFSE